MREKRLACLADAEGAFGAAVRKAGFRLEAGEEAMRVALVPAERHLRPGGTVSGPTMFALALALFPPEEEPARRERRGGRTGRGRSGRPVGRLRRSPRRFNLVRRGRRRQQAGRVRAGCGPNL